MNTTSVATPQRPLFASKAPSAAKSRLSQMSPNDISIGCGGMPLNDASPFCDVAHRYGVKA